MKKKTQHGLSKKKQLATMNDFDKANEFNYFSCKIWLTELFSTIVC